MNLYMHPRKCHGGTPKAARFWVNNWYRCLPDSLSYEFIHTPSGPIIIYKDKNKKDETIYKIKNPKNGTWFTVSHGLEDMKQNLAETIALCFGWKGKVNANRKKVVQSGKG